eukprot:Hpha_TRINITY_DN16622_c4_g8::TRINITY_DN16622_c4_g8_i1::g.181987::m.181987
MTEEGPSESERTVAPPLAKAEPVVKAEPGRGEPQPFVVAPPTGFNACTWRRSPHLDDKAQGVASVPKGETVTGTISGAWFQCAKSGLFLPSYCLGETGSLPAGSELRGGLE